jgi:hypothetical protein
LDRAAAAGAQDQHEEPVLRRDYAELHRRIDGLPDRAAEVLPVIIVMALLGGLMLLTEGTALSPFIYTIF